MDWKRFGCVRTNTASALTGGRGGIRTDGKIVSRGKSPKSLSSPVAKKLPLVGLPKSPAYPSHPVPLRGAYRDRHGNVGCSPLTCMLVCVFTCCLLHARPRVQRASGIPCSLVFRGKTKRKPRASRAARMRARICCLKFELNCHHVITSAAKQSISPSKERMDCFASLAMTLISQAGYLRSSVAPAHSTERHDIMFRSPAMPATTPSRSRRVHRSAPPAPAAKSTAI
jgi:hypothetical protein